MNDDRGFSGGFGGGPLPSGEAARGRLRFTGRLLFGIVLVTLGLLWTLDNLGLADAERILDWWPALLLLYGFVRVTGLDGTRRVVSGVLFMIAGGWMLAREFGFVHVSIFRLWPVFMIFVGASLVWRSVRGPQAAENTDRESYPRPFAFMGGVSRTIESQDLAGMEVSAVMGGVELDLRGSKPRGREVVVGFSSDASLGPILMFGLGGIYVEVLKDVAFAPCPLSDLRARELVRSIRGYPILAGIRGQKGVDEAWSVAARKRDRAPP